MAGIYGNSQEDRYFENELSNYQDREEYEAHLEEALEVRIERAEQREREAERLAWARFDVVTRDDLYY